MSIYGHTATVVGRTKLLVCGGVKGDVACSDVAILNTDNMKWMTPQVGCMAGRIIQAHCDTLSHD